MTDFFFMLFLGHQNRPTQGDYSMPRPFSNIVWTRIENGFEGNHARAIFHLIGKRGEWKLFRFVDGKRGKSRGVFATVEEGKDAALHGRYDRSDFKAAREAAEAPVVRRKKNDAFMERHARRAKAVVVEESVAA